METNGPYKRLPSSAKKWISVSEMGELLAEYVALYGKDNWALSTYDGNVSLINNYIPAIIGDVKLTENQYPFY